MAEAWGAWRARAGNSFGPEAENTIAEAVQANKALHDSRTLVSALQRMLYAATLRGESSHLLAVDHAAGIDLSTLDAVHEESGAGPRTIPPASYPDYASSLGCDRGSAHICQISPQIVLGFKRILD